MMFLVFYIELDYSYFESNKTCQKSLVNDLLTVEI